MIVAFFLFANLKKPFFFSDFKVNIWSYLRSWMFMQRIELQSKFLYIPIWLEEAHGNSQFGSLPYLNHLRLALFSVEWEENRNPGDYSGGERAQCYHHIESVEFSTIVIYEESPPKVSEYTGLLGVVPGFRSINISRLF